MSNVAVGNTWDLTDRGDGKGDMDPPAGTGTALGADIATPPAGAFVTIWGLDFPLFPAVTVGGKQQTIYAAPVNDPQLPVHAALFENGISSQGDFLQYMVVELDNVVPGDTDLVVVGSSHMDERTGYITANSLPMKVSSGVLRYADVDNGNDSWDGLAPTFQGGSNGPKASGAGVRVTMTPGDAAYFAAGFYPALDNVNANDMVVALTDLGAGTEAENMAYVGHPDAAQGAVIFDCGNGGNAFYGFRAQWFVASKIYCQGAGDFFNNGNAGSAMTGGAGGGQMMGHRVIGCGAHGIASNSSGCFTNLNRTSYAVEMFNYVLSGGAANAGSTSNMIYNGMNRSGTMAPIDNITVDGAGLITVHVFNEWAINLSISQVHGFSNGDRLQFLTIPGMTELEELTDTITVVDGLTFTLDTINGLAFTPYDNSGPRHGWVANSDGDDYSVDGSGVYPARTMYAMTYLKYRFNRIANTQANRCIQLYGHDTSAPQNHHEICRDAHVQYNDIEEMRQFGGSANPINIAAADPDSGTQVTAPTSHPRGYLLEAWNEYNSVHDCNGGMQNQNATCLFHFNHNAGWNLTGNMGFSSCSEGTEADNNRVPDGGISFGSSSDSDSYIVLYSGGALTDYSSWVVETNTIPNYTGP